MDIVKVKYYSETTKAYSDREYSYLSENGLKVGDIVTVPVRDTTGKAMVTAVNVPESEVAAFKDKLKVIPAAATEAKPIDRTINLCDTCRNQGDYPLCEGDGIEFGEGQGLDNVIKCANHDAGFPDFSMSYEDYLEALEEDMESSINTNTYDPISPDNSIAVISIKPEIDPAYPDLVSEAAALCRYADLRIIKNDEDAKTATDDLNLIRKLEKSIEGLRDKYVRPLNEHVKAINNKFKTLSIPLDQADKTTEAKILAYRNEVRRKAREAEEINRQKEELARKEAAFNGTGEVTIDTTPVIIPEVAKNVRAETATAGVRSNWKAEVIDFAALSDEYKLPDMTTLNAMARSRKGQNPPAGVKFYDDASLTVRNRY